MQGILVPTCSACGKLMPNFYGANLSRRDLETVRCRDCSNNYVTANLAKRLNLLAGVNPKILSWVVEQGIRDPLYAKVVCLILQRAALAADSEGYFGNALDLISEILYGVYGKANVSTTRPYKTRSHLTKGFLQYPQVRSGNRDKMQIAPEALEILRAVD